MRYNTRQIGLTADLRFRGNRPVAHCGPGRRMRLRSPVNAPVILILVMSVIAFSGCGDQTPSTTTEKAELAKDDSIFDGEWIPITPVDLAELKKDAEKGNSEAQYRLGIAHMNGKGVPKDPTKAFELFVKAASQGYSEAQFFLGLLYIKGDGVPKDENKAIVWIHMAAAQGHAAAQFFLAWIFA